uniref:Myb-like domain-containing protein n=1 Tax=Tanacetum cinerariifolium TaxID=118510 RepID=A0A699GYW6_TANCI|nr:hypothetical protein [Tanacetum cinerariifolium]
MYEPQYSEDYQNTAREDSPIKVVASPLASAQLKSSKRREKKTTQNEEAPWCTAWTNEEEIVLCKGWVHVSEYSAVGNARKECRSWTEVSRYIESKTKAPGSSNVMTNLKGYEKGEIIHNLAWQHIAYAAMAGAASAFGCLPI